MKFIVGKLLALLFVVGMFFSNPAQAGGRTIIRGHYYSPIRIAQPVTVWVTVRVPVYQLSRCGTFWEVVYVEALQPVTIWQ